MRCEVEPRMLGPGPAGVKAKTARIVLVCLVVSTCVSGCFWRNYGARLQMHSDLLVAFARKARDLVASGRFTAENLPELTYPLERATAFDADVRRRAPEPPASLLAFERLLDRYRAYVDLVDRTRRDPAADRLGPVSAALEGVERAARDVSTALADDRRR